MGELLSSRIIASALINSGLPRMVGRPPCDRDRCRAYEGVPADEEPPRPCARRCSRSSTAEGAGVGGFVGATARATRTTLGRGGSDYSGAIVGAGTTRGDSVLTDVDGMLTADPRVIPSRAWCRAAFAEAAELSYFAQRCCIRVPSPRVGRNIRFASSIRGSRSGGQLITAASSPDGTNHRPGRQERPDGGGHHVEPMLMRRFSARVSRSSSASHGGRRGTTSEVRYR